MKMTILFAGLGLCLASDAPVTAQSLSPQQWLLKSDWKMQSGVTDTSEGTRISALSGFFYESNMISIRICNVKFPPVRHIP
jgi:hypothetical protein